MLSVLDLFSRQHTTMTAEQVAEALALTRTTCYRYTRELTQSGLLVSHGGRFMLGPRIIQLDHRMLESDPLINAAGPVVRGLADALGATGLLTASYSDQVVNVFAHDGGPRSLPIAFGRGTSMPLFRSSTSKVLLATLSRGRLRRLWERHAHDSDCQAIGADWKSFWRALQQIDQQGYAASFGELDTGLAGISAAVRFGDGEVAGCMSLIFLQDDMQRFDLQLLGARLRVAAEGVSQSLTPLQPQDAQPPATAATAATARRGTRAATASPAKQGPRSAAKPGMKAGTPTARPARKSARRAA